MIQHLLISKKLCPVPRTYDGPFAAILLDMAEQMLATLNIRSLAWVLCSSKPSSPLSRPMVRTQTLGFHHSKDERSIERI